MGICVSALCILTNQINRNGNVSCDPIKPLAENSIVHLWHFPTGGKKTTNRTSAFTMSVCCRARQYTCII